MEFNEIRLQTNFDDDFQFIYTNSNTYQYKFANLRWQPVRTILLFPLINPVKVQDLDGATCTLLVLEQVVRVQGDVLLKGLGLR